MKLRTQFTLAFLLLAVVPLAAIVLFSYSNSQRALRQAVELEAAELTEEMEERMAVVRRDLATRVRRVGELPLRQALHGAEVAEAATGEERREVYDRILSELGTSAPFVRSFELAPRPGALPEEALEPPGEAPTPERPKFIIEISELVSQVDAEIAEGLAEADLSDEEKRLALEKAKAGVAAAAVIVEGIGQLAEFFTDSSGQELEIGELKVELGERAGETPVAPPEPVVRERPPEPPSAPLAQWVPATGSGDGTALAEEWSSRWEMQQEEWSARFKEWQASWREEMEQKQGAPSDESRVWTEGSEFYVPLREGDQVVGAVRARIAADELLRGVLGPARRQRGEVPFAVDAKGNLFTMDEEDQALLQELALTPQARDGDRRPPDNWVIATSEDPESGLTYGIARPIGESLAQIRAAAARNFAFGVGLIGLALIGMRPLSRRMTGSLRRLNAGVERLAQGDLEARVEIDSKNEIGQLAGAFNRMAEQIREHQDRLLEEERRRRDQEVERKLLEAEYHRKSGELEEARRFQLSLLPETLPRHPSFDLAVQMRTATEVGGDYYDFRLEDDGTLICAIGDATGHGARAGTMVTIVKSLFSAFPPSGGLSAFLNDASSAVRRMQLGRMAMALSLLRLRGREVTLSAAGMPPVLHYRAADGEVDELLVKGVPLGSLESRYREIRARVAPGDTLLLLTDGLPELPDAQGDPLGYGAVRKAFAEAASRPPAEVVAALEEAARSWAGEEPPQDDMTFVVLRIT